MSFEVQCRYKTLQLHWMCSNWVWRVLIRKLTTPKVAFFNMKTKVDWINFNFPLRNQILEWILFVTHRATYFYFKLWISVQNKYFISCKSRFLHEPSFNRWKKAKFSKIISKQIFFVQNWDFSEFCNFEYLLIFTWNQYLSYIFGPILKGMILSYPKMPKIMFCDK